MTRERVELVLTLLHGLLARNGDLNNTKAGVSEGREVGE